MHSAKRYGWVVGLAIACAHAEPARVSDADFGRLSGPQTQPVDAARADMQDAREQLAHAKLGLQNAHHELEAAQAETAAASADEERAKAAMSAANDSRVPAALQNAARLEQEARLHRTASEAHNEWAKKLIEAWSADVDAAQRRLELAQARVDRSRLQALQQANIPAATKYDPSKFEEQVAKAFERFQEAQHEADQRHAKASTTHQQYQSMQQRFQEHVAAEPASSSTASGTGSSEGASGSPSR